MTQQKHFLFALALTSIMLIGQIAVLSHSVEHPFHADEESCQIFLHCQQSANGLISADASINHFSDHQAYVVTTTTQAQPALNATYFARAPPSFPS